MKKILLILITILLAGCYDYKEINDLALISAISVDHDGQNFLITYEILNDNTSSEDASASSYLIKGSGKTIAQSFDNMALKISKIPYYNHLHAVVISENIAKNYFKEFMDYVVRQPTIRNEFFLVLSNEDPSKILESSSEEQPIIGNVIMDLISAGQNNYNPAYPKPFEDIVENTLNPYKDPIVNVVSIEEEKIVLKGIAIFKGYEYIAKFTDQDAALLTTLMGKNDKIILTKEYNQKPVTIKTFSSSIKTEFKNKEIIINLDVAGELEENTPSFDLTSEETFKKLNKDFSKELQEDAQATIDKIISLDSDVLGLKDLYYKKYRKENNNLFKEYKITVKASLKVNKRGLIYEVPNER